MSLFVKIQQGYHTLTEEDTRQN